MSLTAAITCSLVGSTFGFVRPNPNHRRVRCFRQQTDDEDAYSFLSDTLTRRVLMAEDSEATRLEILNQRLVDDLEISKTTVQPSPIAGRGLFATVDCQQGDILTCYPGDGIIRTPDPENPEGWSISWGDHIAPEDRQTMKDLSESIRGYILYMDNEHSILGLPQYDDDPTYLGHFTNDGAKCPTCQAELAAYATESNEVRNAMHQGMSGDCHMVTVATRDIAAGEEIFVTYGAEYWMEQASYVGD